MKKLASAFVALWFLGGLPALAQRMPVPADLQVPILLKVFNYDRAFEERSGETLVIGIAFQNRNRESVNAKDGFLEALSGQNAVALLGLPVQTVLIDLQGQGFEEALAGADIDVLYLTPLRALSVKEVADYATGMGVLTLTGVPEYVSESGVCVGIGQRGNRPSILIHLANAKRSGANFSSDLLKVAQVVDR